MDDQAGGQLDCRRSLVSRGLGGCTGFFQYRARLITPNGGAAPYLTRVSIEFGEDKGL